ncbi:MAG TPA: DUF58 domain-containing protein [Candidatus Udaeobacter sp.]|nr:DUF58 domain-containing protein [Candidatus Udaeobacter sp.]
MKARKLTLIYPTAGFVGLLFVLSAMWYAASSQNNTAVYLLFFALTGVFLISIPHTLVNLAGLTVTLESVQPTFVGQEVSLPLEIMNDSRATRHAIELAMPGSNRERQRIDCIPALKGARITLRFPAGQRGEHKVDILCLTSVYPLGFIRLLKKFSSSQTYIVYPKPAGDVRLPSSFVRSHDGRPLTELDEGDDFAGTRAYVQGESQRHIDWRAVARGQSLMTKQFTVEEEGVVYFDFSALHLADVEERLSQLALWVIEAERARRPYGLRLPGVKIPPAIGQLHFHQCMRAVSLVGFKEQERPPSQKLRRTR